VIKRQFGYVKMRFRGLMKNTAQLTTLFALLNLWMARKQLDAYGQVARLTQRTGRKARQTAIHKAFFRE